MGCCLSTATSSKNKKKPSTATTTNGSDGDTCKDGGNRARAPPPLMEEETVKEVLSETPKIIIHKPIKPISPNVNKIEDLDTIEDKAVKIEKFEKKADVHHEEISEVSEICSVSESIISTTTFNESRDDGESEFKQRIDRSPAKFVTKRSFSGEVKRERVVGRSPVRRSDPSPGRRNDSGGNNVGGGMRSNLPAARRKVGSNGYRRDPGESSGRRSRSPAVRGDATGGGGGANRAIIGRSPSARKTGQSPNRNRENSAAKAPEEKCHKWDETNESIDNPLVSLECFIFL